MVRTKTVSVPEVGEEAPEFHLPSAQGGQLRLSMRTVHGPVVVVFYKGAWSEECVEYFKAIKEKEREINVAGGTVVGIGAAGPGEALAFVRETGIGSYVLYDYATIAIREYGLLEKDREHGRFSRPAVFIVGGDHKVVNRWLDERPGPSEILAKISEITGLPKTPEEEGEARPKKAARSNSAGAEGERKKTSSEEREKRRAAKEQGGGADEKAPASEADKKEAEG